MKTKNLFEIHGAVYETSRFGQRFKRSSGTEIGKIGKENSEDLEHFRNSCMT